MTGLGQAAQRMGFALADIGYLLHGTTIATNAVLEHKLAKGALVTTAQFEDVIEIGRHYRREIYSLSPRVPPILISRDRRVGIEERIRSDGTVETPLTTTAIEQLIRKLDEVDVVTVAICLLNSYLNPRHEIAIAEAIAKTRPALKVSCSSTVSPEIREFERTSTTVLNALLIPIVSGYLDKLAARMRAEGFNPRLLLVQSNGGVCSAETAAQEPVRLLLSGPSGGSAACALLGRLLGEANIVGIDMGGTSFDVSVVREGRANLIMQGEIDHMPVRLPMVEIRTIGAGGGSIAAVQAGGRLQVGPESAGSRPGPACYGRGATKPTVTDANVMLGRLDGEQLPRRRHAARQRCRPGGDFGRDRQAARSLRREAAAEGTARRHQRQPRGGDPSVAVREGPRPAGVRHDRLRRRGRAPCSGGRGRDRRQARVFPESASTLSAYGILHSNLAHDLVRSRVHAARPREPCGARSPWSMR